MWTYERRLQYPVKITKCNPKIAQVIISQYGGPDGEMGASMRYLSQRYSSTNRKVSGILTDIGREAAVQPHPLSPQIQALGISAYPHLLQVPQYV